MLNRNITPRERQVLDLIVGGKSTKEVACVLFVAVNTARRHRENLMRTLGAHNAAQLVKAAIREGVLVL
jgi:DNA-binding CsgD family transcriptional regulator